MLRKDVRRKLIEHNWVDIKDKISNSSQTLKRFRKEIDVALDDMALLAKKLPEDNLQNMFTPKNLGLLLYSILYGNDPRYSLDEEMYSDIDYKIRRAQLAALMAKTGINFCRKIYETKIEHNSILNEPIINQLKKSIEICDEIVAKMYMPQVQSTANKNNLHYLFNGAKIIDTYSKRMDELRNDNVKKFVEFCYQHLGNVPPIVEIESISRDGINQYGEDIKFDLVDEYGTHIVGKLAMDLEASINTATLYDDELKPVIDLVLRKENGGWYIYEEID
jgi:hypothetical protein